MCSSTNTLWFCFDLASICRWSSDWWILSDLKMPVSSSPAALMPPSSLDPESQELFLIRVPSHLPTSFLQVFNSCFLLKSSYILPPQNAVLDLKHPSALQHSGRQYLPVMGKGGARAAVLPGSKVALFLCQPPFLSTPFLLLMENGTTQQDVFCRGWLSLWK